MIDNKSQLMKRMLLLPLVSSLSTSCGGSHQLNSSLFKPAHRITTLARLKQTKKTNGRFKRKQARKLTYFLANLKQLQQEIIKKGGHRYRKLKQANQAKREQLVNENAIFGYLRHASSTNFSKIEAILAKRLAEKSLDINTTKCRGKSLLAYAMKGYEEANDKSGKDFLIEAIKLLIRNGANPSLPGKKGYSKYDNIPILIAASKQDKQLFEALLADDPDVFTVVDRYGRNILHAILNSNQQLGLDAGFLEAVLKHKWFKPEILNQKKHVNGTTPLHYAARKKLTALGLLIQAGANLDVQDVEGNTPLHYAIGKAAYLLITDIAKGVKMLLSAGENPLLKSANLFLKNNQNESPMAWVDTKLERFTSDERKKIKALCKDYISSAMQENISPVHKAVRAGNIEALNQALAENPGAINEKGGSGNTPLFNAISLRNESCARALIAAGADLNLLSNDGKTILYPLVNPGEKNVACLTELCRSVSLETINATTLGGNAANIHYAAGYDNEILEVLVAFGADVNMQDLNGDTPLHYVVTRHTTRLPSENEKASMLAAVQFLCAHRADITLKNKDGKTAFDLAKEINNEAVCALIQKGLSAYRESSSLSGCRSVAEGIIGNAVQPGLVLA
ncbi:MAG: ankyrin repeat domain-containing protein [Amoebophilaceae bacterium]|nr:ankyrin repeat domain-containing protein [Amoebophilaceae bacterium]